MDNQPPSRESLKNSNLSPVDPAFRPATSPEDNSSLPPLSTNPPENPSSLPPNQIDASPPTDFPIADSPSEQPTSSDVKTKGVTPDRPANGLLNLKEFPELKNPQQNDSETKKVLMIGGIITVAIFLTAGTLFLLTKNREDKPIDSDKLTDGKTVSEETAIDKTTSGETTAEKTVSPKKETTTQKHLTLKEGANLLESIGGYFPEISQAEIQKEIRINFYDEASEELELEEMVEELKIMVPDYVAEILTPNYYFFLSQVPSSEIPKATLILESKFTDHKKTEEVLRRWEKYIIRDLKNFVFLGEDADFFNNFINESELYSLEFYSSSKYPGGRYQNFLKDGSISLNYLVMWNKIVITNSFEGFEKAIRNVELDEDL